jgi:uncharacterized protein
LILYLDTSALVKRYFEEPHSIEVAEQWQKADEIATSSVVYAEALASFHRKSREAALDAETLGTISNNFRSDWQTLIRIQVTDELNTYVDRALAAHALRGFDAIHLASAMILRESFLESLLFICFDQRLTQAAKSEGIKTYG